MILEDCIVPVENVLRGAGEGFPIAMNALDNSRIGIAAQALGIAQGSFEAALNYAHERMPLGNQLRIIKVSAITLRIWQLEPRLHD